ncbi:MAG: NUDIX domain-containing protein [Patescibacteria group bacterium]
MDSLHAVAVLIISPEGIPLVRDPKKPAPRYWKLPGGRSEGEETPEECAVREIEEELGLEIDIDELKMLDQQDKRNHTLTFFRINLPSLQGIKKQGDEQEEIHVYKTLMEVARLPDLFPNHQNIVQRAALGM